MVGQQSQLKRDQLRRTQAKSNNIKRFEKTRAPLADHCQDQGGHPQTTLESTPGLAKHVEFQSGEVYPADNSGGGPCGLVSNLMTISSKTDRCVETQMCLLVSRLGAVAPRGRRGSKNLQCIIQFLTGRRIHLRTKPDRSRGNGSASFGSARRNCTISAIGVPCTYRRADLPKGNPRTTL